MRRALAFRCETGVVREVFSRPRLRVRVDGEPAARPDVPMTVSMGDDGCPVFTTDVELADVAAGGGVRWGIVADGPGGSDQWLVPSGGVDALEPGWLRVDSLAKEQVFRLTGCRWLGAQPVKSRGGEPDGIRFAVWAPNARKVDVVLGHLWRQSDGDRTPFNAPGRSERAPFGELCGGFIADDGSGVLDEKSTIPLERGPGGVWSTPATFTGRFSDYDHRPYMFRITCDDGTVRYRTDLHSRCQIGPGTHTPAGAWSGPTAALDGTRSCSVIVHPDLVTPADLIGSHADRPWPEPQVPEGDSWWEGLERPVERPDGAAPCRVTDLVIYELHLGALGFGKSSPGTLDDALPFLDHVADLGVNAIELLPMSEFGASGGGWGYATSHYHAIEYMAGGRDAFKKFVREAHRRGLAVIMDVVYNHYTHDGERAQWLYDTTRHEHNCYYWYDGRPADHAWFDAAHPGQRGHGGYVDNGSSGYAPRYHDPMVRHLFISSAVTLMEEFHVDGFRFDQTTSIHAYNQRHSDGAPVGAANASGVEFLRECVRTLRLLRPGVLLMAEDHSDWDAVTEPVERGGLGFDARWASDFYHHLVGDGDRGPGEARLLREAGFGDDRPLAMAAFGAALGRTAARAVVYHESHDEAGNGAGTARTVVTAVAGAPLVGETRRFAEARCRFAAGMALLSAGTPLFLFGEEIATDQPFLYGDNASECLDIVAAARGPARHMVAFYRDLIRMRLSSAALRGAELRGLWTHDADRVIVFHRPGTDGDYAVFATLANRPFETGYRFPGLPLPSGEWREVFNSDAGAYGGDNVGNGGRAVRVDAGEMTVILPACGFLVFKHVE